MIEDGVPVRRPIVYKRPIEHRTVHAKRVIVWQLALPHRSGLQTELKPKPDGNRVGDLAHIRQDDRLPTQAELRVQLDGDGVSNSNQLGRDFLAGVQRCGSAHDAYGRPPPGRSQSCCYMSHKHGGPSSQHDSPLGAQLADSAYVRPIADSKVVSEDADPATLATEKETLRLAFVAALQHLPAKQRAVLILREVLRWQATEVAALLDTSVAGVNSALQRARATIEELHLDQSGVADVDEAEQKALLAKYVKAFEAYDMAALTALLKDDAAFSMPPFPLWVVGPEQIRAFMTTTGAKCEGSKVLVTEANGGPAFGIYNPTAEGDYAGWAVVVMETSAGRVSGLHHFIDPNLFAEFGLPLRLDGEHVGQPDELQQPA